MKRNKEQQFIVYGLMAKAYVEAQLQAKMFLGAGYKKAMVGWKNLIIDSRRQGHDYVDIVDQLSQGEQDKIVRIIIQAAAVEVAELEAAGEKL